MNTVTKTSPVADLLAYRIRMHGGRLDIRPDGAGSTQIMANAYDSELRYVIDGDHVTAEVDRIDPQSIYPAVSDLPSACRIEIWHGQRRGRRPLRYHRGRDAARCLALAGAMPGSRVSVRIRFANPDSAVIYNDRVLEALRGAYIATLPNVVVFPRARTGATLSEKPASAR